jgi:hypothetical protein
LRGNIPSAFAYPAQGRLWITPCFRLNQALQRGQQLWIAPDRRMRPGSAVPSSISRIPLAMALRESPLARRICEMPPYPNDTASLAAISRRLRSSSSGHTLVNLRRNELSPLLMPK